VYSSDGGLARRDSWLQERTSLHRGVSAASLGSLLCRSESLPVVLARKCKQLVKRWR
jgi:hypothetical protein